MAYRLRLDGEAAPRDGVTLLDDDHDLVADAIIRAAGAVRLLRRLVDPDREARIRGDEVRQARHELADLEASLGPDEKAGVHGALERLGEIFAAAERSGVGVCGGGES